MRPIPIQSAALAVMIALLGTGAGSAAQTSQSDGPERRPPVITPPAVVPFGPGEDLRYKVHLGKISVGDAYLRVEAVDTVRGYPSYHLAMGIDGSAMFGALQIHDRYDSWLDLGMLVSRRFHRRIHEVNYRSRRYYEIYPEEGRWTRVGHEEEGETPTVLALDELSFIYYARTLPLEVGESYELNRYFKIDGNPVRVRVLRKERILVPAGEFDTIVVQPTFQTSGLFSEGGEAEIYLSDDESRFLVLLTSKMPVVGSLSLHLTVATPGTPVAGAAPGR
ncbi:MAG TPA: DUF3108 domain-containing protein [Longimicrobiales bacterium]